jgi:hypothetical protein
MCLPDLSHTAYGELHIDNIPGAIFLINKTEQEKVVKGFEKGLFSIVLRDGVDSA